MCFRHLKHAAPARYKSLFGRNREQEIKACVVQTFRHSAVFRKFSLATHEKPIKIYECNSDRRRRSIRWCSSTVPVFKIGQHGYEHRGFIIAQPEIPEIGLRKYCLTFRRYRWRSNVNNPSDFWDESWYRTEFLTLRELASKLESFVNV